MGICEVFNKNAGKHEIMGNGYTGCHYTDEIQKSHRKTGCISSHDQEITRFSICLLIVCCRKGGLWQWETENAEVQGVPGGCWRTVCPLYRCICCPLGTVVDL